jgi:hypothetical protein
MVIGSPWALAGFPLPQTRDQSQGVDNHRDHCVRRARARGTIDHQGFDRPNGDLCGDRGNDPHIRR